MYVFIGIFILLFIIMSVIFICMAHFAVRPNVHTLEYELDYLDKLECMKGESLAIENEHQVTTFDGEKLWVGLVQGDPKNKHYVILSHGYTSTRYGVYKYAVLWRKLGYNCVLYDNRGHGVNQRATITFGIRESRDLMTVIEDTYERYGQDIHIGLHGESMGAGLQVMALEYKPKVDFIVNDCGYSEILPVLRWKVQSGFHLPGRMADWASPYARLLFGYWFQEVRPIDRLKENEIPICFVHGTSDHFTAHWHSEKMYEVNKGYKELHLFEGVDHASCIVDDTERYFRMMKDFIARVYADEQTQMGTVQ